MSHPVYPTFHTGRTVPMKKHNPGGASYGYNWPDEDAVVEVAEEHVDELEKVSRGDIYQADRTAEHAAAKAVLEEAAAQEVEAVLAEEFEPEHPELERSASDLSEAVDVASGNVPVKRGPGRPPKAKTE